MDKLDEYRKIVKQIIKEYAKFKPAYGNIEVETIFDTEKDHYGFIYLKPENILSTQLLEYGIGFAEI